MIYARKGNQISRIEEQQISNLVEQGFDIVDERGAVLHKAVPTDLNALKRAYIDNTKRIGELEKEIESLKKSTKKTTPKAEKVEVEEEATEEKSEEQSEEVKPKRASKK